MEIITSSLITASNKAVKFLKRDYLELEMLQRASKGNNDFCNKSYTKTVTLLKESLHKQGGSLFFPQDKLSLDDVTDDILFLINPIDSLANFERSIPFFALTITCLKKINKVFTAISTVVNFPVFNKICYAEKGRGVKIENNGNVEAGRLRVSGCNSLNDFIIATDNISLSKDIFKNIRISGSPSYGALMMASGKIDAIYFLSLNYTLQACFELLILESGGVILDKGKNFIASNSELATKFKQMIV